MQDQILAILRKNAGNVTSSAIQLATGAVQSAVSRAITPLIHQGVILKTGAARSQVYLLPRQVPGIGEFVPLMKVGIDGAVNHAGRLIPIHGGGYWLESNSEWVSGAHASLPWFVQDMRPQGFLGRSFAKNHPALQLAENPEHWSDDDILRALCVGGQDLFGNLIVGAASLDRYQNLTFPPVTVADYTSLAEQAIQGVLSGSSAGGEQPKFCAFSQGCHVIVKFSPSDQNPASQRLRDILIAEHLALEVLNQSGIEASRSNLETAGGRVFLEVERFDRVGLGRVGMVSLLSYDSEYVGSIDNWAKTAERMLMRQLLSPDDARTLRLLEAFGRLIGNTDRHYGNISLLRQGKYWRLAPVYDFLPMIYAPINGELVKRDFNPADLNPTSETLDVWGEASDLAGFYWSELAADMRLSDEFRVMAKNHAEALLDETYPKDVVRQKPNP